jgi:glycosyltransferase involved in cell wall biosynthesis
MEPRESWLWPAQALGRLAVNLGSLPRLLRQLRAWRIDVVVTNNSILPVGAFAAARLGRPHVWIIREFGSADYPPDFGRASFDFWLRRATRVIAISEALRRGPLARLPPERVEVIPNGVARAADFATLRQRALAEPRDPGRFTFLLMGRILPAKGQEVAIRALARLAPEFPAARLELVGGGEARHVARCRTLVAQLGLGDRVALRDWADDPWPHFLRADAVLMCSASEGMGRVTAEAMAAGRPVIGHATGGTPELIRHEETGLLYTGSDEPLAAAMRRFLEEPDWVRRLGDQAWQDARERFTLETCADRVARCLRAAAAQTAGQTAAQPSASQAS